MEQGHSLRAKLTHVVWALDFARKPSYCSEFERRCVVCEQ